MSIGNIPATQATQTAAQSAQTPAVPQPAPETKYEKPRVPVINPGYISKTPVKDKLDTLNPPKAPYNPDAQTVAKNNHGDELLAVPRDLGVDAKDPTKKKNVNILGLALKAAVAGVAIFAGVKAFRHFKPKNIKDISNAANLSNYKQGIDKILKNRDLKAKDFKKVVINTTSDTSTSESLKNVVHLGQKFALVDGISPKIKILMKEEAQGTEAEVIQMLKDGNVTDDVLSQIDLIELSKLNKPQSVEANSIVYEVITQKSLDADNVIEVAGSKIRSTWKNWFGLK